MRFVFCVIMTLCFFVFAGCFGLENVTKDDVSDVADCYEQTVIVDDHYAIILDKDCMDFALLSSAPKIALEAESIEKAEEAPEPEVTTEYPCPIEDRGDWTLLVTLKRNNFNLNAFRVPKEWIDLITQEYVDGKDFLFIIYKPAIPVQPDRYSDATRSFGNSEQARYYLEAPGLLHNNSLIDHFQRFHFVDSDAFWFRHWDTWRDRTQSGFIAIFNTLAYQNANDQISQGRDFVFGPEFGSTMDGFGIGGPGAPEINEYYELDIYVR